MPIYDTPQAGSYGPPNQGKNVTAVGPGDSITLFDGTESPAQGLSSIAFARGDSGSQDDAGLSVFATGMASDLTIDIQGSNVNVDGSFTTLEQLFPDANGNAAATDIGRAAFYRAQISAYSSGTMPTCTVQR